MSEVKLRTLTLLLLTVLGWFKVQSEIIIKCDFKIAQLMAADELEEYVEARGFIVDADSFYQESRRAYCSAIYHDNIVAKAQAINQIGFFYYSTMRYTEAADFLMQARVYSEQGDYKQGLADYYCYMGLVSQGLQNYEQALLHFRELLKFAKEEESLRWEADAYANIGSTYLSMGEKDEAEELLLKALALAGVGSESESMGWANVHLGSLHFARGDSVSGLEYFDNAIDLWIKHDDTRGLAYIHNEMGRVFGSFDVEQSLFHYRRGLKYAQESGFRIQELIALLHMGKLYRKSNLDSATYYLEKTVVGSDDGGDYWVRKAASNMLMDIYEELGSEDEYEHYLEVSYLTAEKIIEHQEGEFRDWLKLDQEVVNLEDKSSELLTKLKLILKDYRRLSLLALLLFVLIGLAVYYAYRFFCLNKAFKVLNKKLASNVQLLKEQSQTLANNNDVLKEQKNTLASQLRNRLAMIRDSQVHRNEVAEAVRSAKVDEADRQRLLRIVEKEGNAELLRSIDQEMQQINSSLFSELMKRHPTLTANNLRLLSYVKMNLSNKEIADLLYISTTSLKVAKSRLIKRMELDEGTTLIAYLHSMG